jgi:hypothetical protein
MPYSLQLGLQITFRSFTFPMGIMEGLHLVLEHKICLLCRAQLGFNPFHFRRVLFVLTGAFFLYGFDGCRQRQDLLLGTGQLTLRSSQVPA